MRNCWKIEYSSKEMQRQDKTVSLKVMGLNWDHYKDKFDAISPIQFIENSDKIKRILIRF